LLILAKESGNTRTLSFGILIGRLIAKLAKVDPNILSFWNCRNQEEMDQISSKFVMLCEKNLPCNIITSFLS